MGCCIHWCWNELFFLLLYSFLEHLTEFCLEGTFLRYKFLFKLLLYISFSYDFLLAKLLEALFSLQELKLSLVWFREFRIWLVEPLIRFWTSLVVTTMKCIAATQSYLSCSVAVLRINFRSNVSKTK